MLCPASVPRASRSARSTTGERMRFPRSTPLSGWPPERRLAGHPSGGSQRASSHASRISRDSSWKEPCSPRSIAEMKRLVEASMALSSNTPVRSLRIFRAYASARSRLPSPSACQSEVVLHAETSGSVRSGDGAQPVRSSAASMSGTAGFLTVVMRGIYRRSGVSAYGGSPYTRVYDLIDSTERRAHGASCHGRPEAGD